MGSASIPFALALLRACPPNCSLLGKVVLAPCGQGSSQESSEMVPQQGDKLHHPEVLPCYLASPLT